MNNSGIRRNNRKIAKRGLTPAQKSIAFTIAQEFELGVHRESLRLAKFVHLNGMVNH